MTPSEKTRSRLRSARRLTFDRLARCFVTFGGMAIILAILAILFVIVAECYPLFEPPAVTLVGRAAPRAASAPLAVSVDEHREIACLVTATGVRFVSVADGRAVSDGRAIPSPALPGLGDARVTAASASGPGRFVLGLSDGRVLPVEATFTTTFTGEGARRILPSLLPGKPDTARTAGHPVTTLASSVTKDGALIAVTTAPRVVVLMTVEEQRSLFGGVRRTVARRTLSLPIEGRVRALAIDNRGAALFAGTSLGRVVRVDLRDAGGPRVAGIVPAARRPGVGISVLGFLTGDRTLIVGDAAGGVSSWQVLRGRGGEGRLRKMHDFTPHPARVTAFSASLRDKGFVTVDASGGIHLSYGTTGKTRAAVQGRPGLTAVAFAPKADGILTADASGRLAHWAVGNPHPGITWRSLFGKLWYEGGGAPEYVYQSTGGSDDFEAKFSLTPLIYGTLKGTFYSLLFAIPLALLSALYVSQFMHPAVKGAIKPMVEIMAALPSVVLGFIAGLWLAPVVERFAPALFLAPFTIAGVILVAHAAWRHAPPSFRHALKPGAEIFLLLPVVLAGGGLALYLGARVEHLLLSGDYRSWLSDTLGVTYDQRNALVVGLAMGFAVIPIIFTIAEDALSGVPRSFSAGSLALGATRWQTAVRMVLPSAAAGIFSAVMIGFGRAVGETMIVLMATGNTPVMDMSIFNGFRALSANIAVELPEAPQNGTLYRVLFLSALLLFVMTFVVNTLAEIVRLRLRKKYRYL